MITQTAIAPKTGAEVSLRVRVAAALIIVLWTAHSLAAGPDLNLTGTDSPDPVTVGELLNYNLVVTNVGTSTATGVMLTNTLSTNATFFSASVSQGTFTSGGGLVVCDLGSINAGSAATVRITATPGTAGTITNSAIVTLTQVDANLANNSATQTTLVVPLTFYPGPNLNVARSWHTATLLPDGRVLIAGGNTGWGGSPLASAEIYDPATKTFTLTGNMHVARDAHVAALLADGTVLVAGGYSSGSFVGAEVFNPTNGTFTSVSNLNNWHVDGSATLMQDGRVLVEGNDYYGTYAAAEIYVPALHAFTNIGTTLGGGTRRPAFLLGDGKVLLPGGTIGNAASGTSAEYYDPALNQFVALPQMNHGRYINGGAQLLDGRVLIAGGNASGNTAEFFYTNSQNFVAATNLMRSQHWFCTANRLADGKVLLAGFSQTPDLFDPSNDSFSRTADMLAGRLYYTATTLRDGSVLIVGGQLASNQTGPALATTEIYDPARTKPPPAVSITNAVVVEGNSGTTNLNFQLTLSSPMGVPVSVNYATASGSATDGEDFIGTNDIAVFPPGTTNLILSVPVIGDVNYEADETLSVTLSSPTNAVIDAVNATATGTILNDDPQPTVSVASASVLEPNVGTTNLALSVSLSSYSFESISVDWTTTDGSALAGSDYIATNGTLTFDPGVTNLTVSVAIKGDTLYESNEVFYVTLSPPANAAIGPPGVVTIISDDGLPGVLDHFTFSAIPTPQYATLPVPLTITAMDASNSVVTSFNGSVMLTGSASNTPAYTFDFEEGDFSQWTPLNLGNSPGPYQIVPFDVSGHGHQSLAFRIAANSGAADGITRPVTLQGGTIYSLSVDLAASNDYGINGDASTAHVLINGQELGSFNFNVFGEISAQQIFRTNLTVSFIAPSNGVYDLSLRFDRGYGESGVWSYADNVRITSPRLTPTWISPFTNGVWSGNLVAATAGSNIVLHVDDSDGHFGDSSPFSVVDYADVALQTAIAPNPARVGASLVYTLLATNLGPGMATGLVVTNLLPPNQTFLSATSSVGTCFFSNGVVTCAFGCVPANQAATVTIVTQPFLPGTVTNFAGFTSANFDPNPANNISTTTFLVNPPLIYVSSPTVVERTGTTTNAQFQVWIGSPFVQTIDVDFATAAPGQGFIAATPGADYLATSGHLTFTPGLTNQTITVTVLDNLINEPTEAFAVVLSNPTNAQIATAGICSILDNFDPLPLISISDASLVEGNSGTNNMLFNVTLSRPAVTPCMVRYATSSGTAIGGSDFVTNSGTLSFPPGTTGPDHRRGRARRHREGAG